MDDAIRTTAARKSDVIARLEGDLDAWIATAESGRAHLVPLSLAWDGVMVILATPASSRTARNARASRQARLALGTSRDVVLIDAAVETVPCKAAAQAVAESYQARTGWDPRAGGGGPRLPARHAAASPGVAQSCRDRGAHPHPRRPLEVVIVIAIACDLGHHLSGSN